MSEQDLLFDSRVLLLAANVAVAAVIVGLAGLSLRRCVGGRSLPLQHGVLTAAVAALLLAPVLFAVSSVIPGVGIRLSEGAAQFLEGWAVTGPAAGVGTRSTGSPGDEMFAGGPAVPPSLTAQRKGAKTWTVENGLR